MATNDGQTSAIRTVAYIGRFIFPALGTVFCVLNGMGMEIACLTTGCSVYADYAFLGLSFYVWGAMAFGAATVCAGLDRFRPGLYTALAATLLLADVGFLAWQTAFMPCSSCLVVAALLALALWAGLLFDASSGAGWLRRGAQVILVGWLALFCINATDAVREQLRPWPIHGDPETAQYEIWFSLTCPHCRETLQTILYTPEMADLVVLYPVAKDDNDIDKFDLLYCGLEADVALDAALEESWDAEECDAEDVDLTRGERLTLRLRLAWNKALLVRKGYTTVPVLISNKLVVIRETCKIHGEPTDPAQDTLQGRIEPTGDVIWLEEGLEYDPEGDEACGDEIERGCSVD